MSENKNHGQGAAPEAAPPTAEEYNEQVRIRREKLAALKERGEDPYQLTTYNVTAYAEEIRERFEELDGKTVSIAGRLMSRRIMGKASFCHLQDVTGKMQSYVRRDDVGEEIYADFKKWDIGDIIGIEGFVFRTQTGEVSVHAKSIKLLSKSLLPLPEK